MINRQLYLAVYIFMRNFAISKLKTTILKGRCQTEKLVAMLHVGTTFDKILDKGFIIQNIIKPACEYYMKFATMADAEMLEEDEI